MGMFRAAIVAAACFTASLGAASAAPVTWYLQDFVFGDGGTASGSFVFDASTGSYSDIMITTTDGTTRSGEVYGAPNPSSSGNATVMIALTTGAGDLTGVPQLAIEWSAALTDLGGIVAADIAGFTFEAQCAVANCASVQGPIRFLSSGFITSDLSQIPAPAALPLFLAGVAGLGAARRRKKMAAR